jgi:predicted lipoprotein with Yx(FWY)xxD motif
MNLPTPRLVVPGKTPSRRFIMRSAPRPPLTVVTVTTAVATALALAGCGGSDGGGYGVGEPATDDAGTAETAGEVTLTTADSDLGEIVVDGEGMTVYYFTNDEPGSGASSCTGECLAMWPPVHADGEEPEVEGVTAEVGTITGTDGELQVTVDDRPVYLYAGDSEPGDVTGQGVNDVWWVVAPDGAEVTEVPTAGLGDGGGY